MQFVQARNYTKGPRRGPVRFIVIHSMESHETTKTAENVASWFAGPSAPKASAHYCIDSDSIVQCVSEEDIAWHAPGVNADGIGIELAGRAAQSREDWLDDFGTRMLEHAADLIADICSRHDIPAEYVGAEGLRTKTPGLVGHVDATVAFGKVGGHVDPGPHFPWDHLLALVRARLAQPGTIVRPEVPLGRPALDE